MDKSYRDIIAKKIKITDLMPMRTYKAKNKNKSWEYGKHTKYDENFIIISKDGTLGEIWQVGGLKIGLPSSEGKEILNANLPSEKSVWKRTPIPKEFINLERNYRRDMRVHKGAKRNDIRRKYVIDKGILETKYKDFIAQEFDRRKNGLFIKIDNEVVYITGENYMFLNYYFLAEDKIYPNFRMTAVHTWWHWEAVVADPDSWGELRLKSRRVAWTVEACSVALNKFTRTKYAEIPIVSETDRLAGKLFQNKIVNPFKYYPTYFIPLIEKPNEKPKTQLEITFNTDDQETSVISTYPTKAVAYDSTKATFGINDEVGKYTNVSFTEFRGNHKDCYFKGMTRIVGKGKFGSTAGDFANGGSSFQYEFEQANPLKRDSLGRTETGLVALFVDDVYTSSGFFDKWGYPIVYDPKQPVLNEFGEYITLGAITVWNMTADKMKKSKKSDYNNFLRQHPRKIEHAFRDDGNAKNDFDINNLNEHSDFLESIPESEMIEIMNIGNLVWKDDKKKEVIWKPDPNGKFRTTWIPEKKDQNKQTTIVIGGKQWKTGANADVGAFGVDSYDMIGDTKNKRGSDGSIVGFSKTNMIGAPWNSFFLVYRHRPKVRDDFYEDVIKACVFFGLPALIEDNKPRLLEYMYDNGFTGYSIRRPDKKYKHMKPQEQKYGGIPSSTNVIGDQADLLQKYILDNIGQNLENECSVYHLDLINEWKKYDLHNRTKFDLAVASGMAIMGAKNNVNKRRPIFINREQGITLASFGA